MENKVNSRNELYKFALIGLFPLVGNLANRYTFIKLKITFHLLTNENRVNIQARMDMK